MSRNTPCIITNARLMEEWDWEENEKQNLDPRKLTLGSGKKASWICSKGHKWVAVIYHRTTRSTNCPYCSNKKILPGYNDLQSQYPTLMAEWDYTANTINPSLIAAKSNKVAAWICPKGHQYNKAIYLRTSGGGCPTCAHARKTSFPEQCFYFYIKQLYPDAINSYKEIFNTGMELDIYIPSIKTGIEYDGTFWHNSSTISREKKKYQICKSNNVRLFRIKEGSFENFLDNADKIWFVPSNCDHNQLSFYIVDFLQSLTLHSFYHFDVNVARDKNKILEFLILPPEKSLLYLHPEVSKEWHPTKNGKLTPDQFTPGSDTVVWWLCTNCQNEWQASISNRANGHGCDICATVRRKVTKKETLLSKRGSINKEHCLLDWDYEANEFGPEHYTNGSGEIVSWQCHKCFHKWKAAICDRTRDSKNGCPLCSGKVIVSGVNDLASIMPELLEEWDYDSNTEIDPTKVGIGSHIFAFWKCRKCGYKWKAKIYNRVHGKGCPCCANRVIVPGINDLATTDPELAAEWHPTLNTLLPTEVSRGQSKQIYWLCPRCSNVWQDTINHRSNGRGCSKCKKASKHK